MRNSSKDFFQIINDQWDSELDKLHTTVKAQAADIKGLEKQNDDLVTENIRLTQDLETSQDCSLSTGHALDILNKKNDALAAKVEGALGVVADPDYTNPEDMVYRLRAILGPK